MKTGIVLLLLFTLQLNSCFLFRSSQEKDPLFVYFVQAGQQTMIGDTVLLAPAPFEIVFDLGSQGSMLVNASFDEHTYLAALKGKPIEELPGFELKVMTGKPFNPDRNIHLSEFMAERWHFTDEDDHVFNDVTVGDRIICNRTVESLYDFDLGNAIDLASAELPVYIVIILIERDRGGFDDIKELQRLMIMINWEL